jgi:non-homologous end joining protein Ku
MHRSEESNHAACSSAERIAFRQINKATGNRLRQQLIDDETREPVDPEHKGHGYEIAKGRYLIVEDGFAPRQQIDQRFFDVPYYVTPNAPVAQEAFAMIQAMRHKTMVALGRLVLCKRERVIALAPCAIPMRCAMPRTILPTCLRWRYSPCRSWRAKSPGSTRKLSATVTRRRCSGTSRPNRSVRCGRKGQDLRRPSE